nr:phospholipase-like protein [Tanacetum cinerariifolium]
MLLVGGETENVPLYYHMYDNFLIPFGREEFCLVTGLKFGVEYSDDYDDKDKPIPFRRRVFLSRLDGKHITGKDVEELIKSKLFKILDDDAVSLCCICFLQLVLLGLEDRQVLSTMLRDFLHGRVPAKRLIADEVEARSGWWISSRAYFDGCVTKQERRPCHLNHQNHYEGGPSSFRTPTNNSIFNIGPPTNWQTSMPSQPDSSNWQSQLPAYTPTINWQPPILSHPGDAGLWDPRPRRVQRPSVYIPSPYTPLPPTTELPKKRVGRTKKNSQNDNLSPLNLENAFAHDNVGGDDVLITGVHDTVGSHMVGSCHRHHSWIVAIIEPPLAPVAAHVTIRKQAFIVIFLTFIITI